MKVNGEFIHLESEMLLSDFLALKGYNIKHIAVEKNGDIIPKSTFSLVSLNDNDILEIVSFVGGG